MRGFYPILDLETCARYGIAPLEVAHSLLSAQPSVLQVRAKQSTARDTLALLVALRPLTLARGTLLFANDRPDLAQLAGCDGVHLGQEDLPIEEVRRFAPSLRIGLSTHSLEQLLRALDQRPDYVALGPIFPTRSKTDAEPCVGLEVLTRAARNTRARGVPLVAIGGIDDARLASVVPHVDMVALIGAVMATDAGEIERRARQIASAF